MQYEWHIRDRVLTIERRPLVMGIVNVTPDSFSDGGCFARTEAALAHAQELIRQGADILDIGGESTRPGALPVGLAQELDRVVPVVAGLAQQATVPLSVDTSKAEVARAALAAGAHIVNDVTALRGDPAMAAVVRDFKAGAVLVHMQGTPATMQRAPYYDDVIADIISFFHGRLETLGGQGITAAQLALDPGIGFGKTEGHNLEILARLADFQRFGRPLCLGASRKGFIGRLLNRPLDSRLAGSLAVVCHALGQGTVQIVRVHDVQETRDAVTVFAAIQERAAGEDPCKKGWHSSMNR